MNPPNTKSLVRPWIVRAGSLLGLLVIFGLIVGGIAAYEMNRYESESKRHQSSPVDPMQELRLAITVADTAGVERLLNEHPKLLSKAERSHCPTLALATQALYLGDSARVDLVTLLLNKTADPNLADSTGRTPLHYAAQARQWKIASLLLRSQADPNLQDLAGNTPLHDAVRHGSTDIVRLLLETAARPDDTNAAGDTPLMLATTHGQSVMSEELINAGADPNVNNIEGATPLHLAVKQDNRSLVSQLIRAKSNLDSRDSQGRTPLHIAAEHDEPRLATMLLEAGADPNAVNLQGRTPLHIALASKIGGRTKVEYVLESHGCSLTARDHDGHLPGWFKFTGQWNGKHQRDVYIFHPYRVVPLWSNRIRTLFNQDQLAEMESLLNAAPDELLKEIRLEVYWLKYTRSDGLTSTRGEGESDKR